MMSAWPAMEVLCPPQNIFSTRPVLSLCLSLSELGQRSRAAVGWREEKPSSGSATVAGACTCLSKCGDIYSWALRLAGVYLLWPCPIGQMRTSGSAQHHSGVWPNSWEGLQVLMSSACLGGQGECVSCEPIDCMYGHNPGWGAEGQLLVVQASSQAASLQGRGEPKTTARSCGRVLRGWRLCGRVGWGSGEGGADGVCLEGEGASWNTGVRIA